MKRSIAALFGIGRFPVAPGTAGSLAAALLGLVLHWTGGAPLLLASAVAVGAAGFWSLSGKSGFAENDPPWVVIDEAAGQLIALVPVSAWLDLMEEPEAAHLFVGWLFGFLLFRILDIWKPWVVGRADRIEGGVGIMLDDILAGAGAAAALAIVLGAAELLGWIP